MPVRNVLATLTCAVMLVALPARAQPAPQSAPLSAIEIMEQRGSMMVGMATFVPWAMRDAQRKLVGFAVDAVSYTHLPALVQAVVPRRQAMVTLGAFSVASAKSFCNDTATARPVPV